MCSQESNWVAVGHQAWASVNLTAERFAMQINKPAQHDFEFDEACDWTAQKLVEDFGEHDLYLGLSGGLDSELVANVLLRNRIAFVPFVLSIPGINDLEVWHAHHWCWRNNVQPLIHTMSVAETEQQMLPNLARIKNTHQAGLIMMLWMADYVAAKDGKLITAVAELNWDLEQKTFYSNTVDYVLNLFDGSRHPTGFFSYTPELVLSYVKQFNPALNEQYNKINFYQVPPRPKYDWTSNFPSFSPKMQTVMTSWLKHTPNSKRHEFGDQQTVIDLVTATK
jgi:hypothetical protein